MKLTGYLRVSTDRQADEGLGLDVQERAIRAWAKAAGHKVVAWRKDEGISGSNGLDTRAALAEALEDVSQRRTFGIVVYRLDRLARDLIMQETLLREIRKLGGEVFTTSAAEAEYLTDDDSDPSRKLIRQILGAVNEYERAMIALRLRSGRALKHQRGGYAYGGPPFGWRAEGKALVADNAEQGVLDRMRQDRAEGASYASIAASLNADGIPARRGSWHPQTVSRALGREIAVGRGHR